MELTKEEMKLLSALVLQEAARRHNDYAPESATAPLFQLGWRLKRNAENAK